MKTALITSVLLGTLLGAGAAYRNVAGGAPDPGLMKPRTYIPPDDGTDAETLHGPDASPDTEDGANRLAVEVLGGEEFDFGVMDEGEERSHDFVFRNNTDQPVAIEVLETTCKCTVGTQKTKTIPPRGEAEVKLTWKPIVLERDFRQSATIKTDCDQRPRIVISVHGQVTQSLIATPRSIAFSDVSIHKSRKASFVIYAFKDPDFEITSHSWEVPETQEYFTFETVSPTPEQEAAEEDAVAIVSGIVRLKSGLPLGPFLQVLRLNTNVERFGVLEIPLHGRVVGDISLSGNSFVPVQNRLKWGPVTQKDGMVSRLRMTVKGRHAKDFEITDVETTPEFLKIDVVDRRELPSGTLTLLTLDVAVPPASPPVNYSGGVEHPAGQVILHTTHPEIETFRFDVEFAVTE